MTAAGTLDRRPAPRFRVARANLLFGVARARCYAAAAALAVHLGNANPDRMMLVAERALGGNLDSDSLKGAVDTVNVGGRYYLAVGPLQLLPYLPFAARARPAGNRPLSRLPALRHPGAWLSLPLARAFGARGRMHFGSRPSRPSDRSSFYVSVFGDMYYLATPRPSWP